MSQPFTPPLELRQLVHRAQRRGLQVACDIRLLGNYPVAVQLISAAGQSMYKPAELTSDAIHLRFWRLGIDYGVHAFDASDGAARWVRQ